MHTQTLTKSFLLTPSSYSIHVCSNMKLSFLPLQFDPLLDKERKPQVRGLGTDVALVSSMVFLAQFILSSCIGAIVHAAGSTVAVMVMAAVLSFCGALSATKIMYLDL